jgi:hypothetical protein
MHVVREVLLRGHMQKQWRTFRALPPSTAASRALTTVRCSPATHTCSADHVRSKEQPTSTSPLRVCVVGAHRIHLMLMLINSRGFVIITTNTTTAAIVNTLNTTITVSIRPLANGLCVSSHFCASLSTITCTASTTACGICIPHACWPHALASSSPAISDTHAHTHAGTQVQMSGSERSLMGNTSGEHQLHTSVVHMVEVVSQRYVQNCSSVCAKFVCHPPPTHQPTTETTGTTYTRTHDSHART